MSIYPHWLKALVRCVTTDNPYEPAWTRVHPTHDDEDARFAFYQNLPMGCARIEHWRAVIAGVAVDYWTAAAVVRGHRYGGESYVSAAEAVGDVEGLIERVGEAEREAVKCDDGRGNSDGQCC